MKTFLDMHDGNSCTIHPNLLFYLREKFDLPHLNQVHHQTKKRTLNAISFNDISSISSARTSWSNSHKQANQRFSIFSLSNSVFYLSSLSKKQTPHQKKNLHTFYFTELYIFLEYYVNAPNAINAHSAYTQSHHITITAADFPWSMQHSKINGHPHYYTYPYKFLSKNTFSFFSDTHSFLLTFIHLLLITIKKVLRQVASKIFHHSHVPIIKSSLKLDN